MVEKKKTKLLSSENFTEKKLNRKLWKKNKTVQVKCYCGKNYSFDYSIKIHFGDILEVGSCIFCHKITTGNSDNNFAAKRVKKYKEKWKLK